MTTYSDELGNTFELPKLTIALAEEMDGVPHKGGFKETAKAMYDFVKKILPADYLKTELDGTKLDSIDIVKLRVFYDGINTAYTSALEDGRVQSMNEQIENITPMLEALDKAMELNRQASSRQGFARVK